MKQTKATPNMLGKWLATLLVLAIGMTPIYLLQSGGIQIAHGLFAIYAVIVLVSYRLRLTGSEWLLVLLALLILAREWAVIAGGFGQVESVLEFFYIIFGFLICACIRRASEVADQHRAIGLGVMLATAVAIVGLLTVGDFAGIRGASYVRSIGTFNNPNQLAYFSVLCTSLLAVAYLSGHCRTRFVVMVLPCLVFLSLAALSKGGLVAEIVGATALTWIIVARKLSIEVATFAMIAVAFLIFILWSLGVFDDYLFAQRLAQIGADGDDSLSNRGYFVWLDGSAEHLLFGLGQVGVISQLGHEVHSTIVSVFGKYGAVGGFLFLAFIASWFWATKRHFGWFGVFGIFLPPMLYGLTHNGARFTLFWVLIAATLAFRRAGVGQVLPAGTALAPRQQFYSGQYSAHLSEFIH